MEQWILIGIAMIVAIWAQNKVQSTYQKYREIPSSSSLTGAQIAQTILDYHNINDVEVVLGQGAELSDFYDPTKKIVSLSNNVYHTNSIAAVSIAAHEVGHAIQHATGYAFIKLRNKLLPLTIVASNLSIFIIIISSMFINTSSGLTMFLIGIGLYGVIALFQIITLPIELDASKRALVNIETLNLVSPEDLAGANDMLKAAAFTYVAAALGSVITVLRLLLMAFGGRRRN